jgi:predicted small lipoprotein YifL
MNKSILLLATGLTLIGCDRSGDDYVPAADGTYPAVIDVGEMAVMTADQL